MAETMTEREYIGAQKTALKKNKNGNYIPSSISLSFDDDAINNERHKNKEARGISPRASCSLLLSIIKIGWVLGLHPDQWKRV